MNRYYEIYSSNKANGRGPVFDYVTKTFSGKMKILEIGSIRDLNSHAVAGDGWSTFWWCDYIKENGGSLTVVDINPQAIENCKIAVEDFSKEIEIDFNAADGLPFISSEYDFIYLDGSDCPKEMLNQFKNIDRNKTSILCDDFDQKGALLSNEAGSFLEDEIETEKLRVKVFENYTSLVVPNGQSNGHRMAFYPKK